MPEMKSKRLLTELLDYIELFEQSFPLEEELSLKSFLIFAQSMQEAEVSCDRYFALLLSHSHGAHR